MFSVLTRSSVIVGQFEWGTKVPSCRNVFCVAAFFFRLSTSGRGGRAGVRFSQKRVANISGI